MDPDRLHAAWQETVFALSLAEDKIEPEVVEWLVLQQGPGNASEGGCRCRGGGTAGPVVERSHRTSSGPPPL